MALAGWLPPSSPLGEATTKLAGHGLQPLPTAASSASPASSSWQPLPASLLAATAIAVSVCRRPRRHRQNALSRKPRVPASAAFDAAAWRQGFREAEELEDGYYFLEVEGLPADLCGTYFRNGPGKFKVGEHSVTHELDADGLMLGISFFEGGKVCVRHRLVQTQGLLRDAANEMRYQSGMYGTPPEGALVLDPRRNVPKHTASEGVVYWADKLLALWSFGKPFTIDPACLATNLETEDDGSWDMTVLDKDSGYDPAPKVCGNEGCLTNISQTRSAVETTVRFTEFAAGEWRPRYQVPRAIKVNGYTKFSGFAITKKWFVLAKPPLKANGIAAATGQSFHKVLEFDEAGTGELIFATRLKREETQIEVPVDNLVCEEFANAYEIDDGRVVVDMVAADRWDVGVSDSDRPNWEEDPSSRPRRRLMRYEVDLRSQTWTKRELCSRHLGRTSVNQSVCGKKHRFVFAAVAHEDDEVGPMAGIAKIDVDSGDMDAWVPGAAEFADMPQFVPRPGATEEDDGYLIAVVFNGESKSSDVVVIDAKDIAKGPVSRFSLRSPLPHGLRSCWVEGMTFEEEVMKRKMTLLNMFRKKMLSWNALDAGFSTIGSQPFFQKQGVKMR